MTHDERKRIVQQILHRSTDFLRRIIVPVGGQGGVTKCPRCHRYPLEDKIWWVSTGHGNSKRKKTKQCNSWCAACAASTTAGTSNRVLVKLERSEAKVFRPHAPPQDMCENLMNALKSLLLANQQMGGDSLVEVLVEDDGRAQKVHHGGQSRVIIDGDRRWWTRIGSPLARLFIRAPEGEEWERLCRKYLEMHKAVNIGKPGNSHKANSWWTLRHANTNGEARCGKRCGRMCKARQLSP